MAKQSRRSYTITLPAGTQIELQTVVDLKQGYGTFYKHGEVLLGGSKKELLRGFAVKHDAIGILELPEGSTEGVAVVYRQVENKENSVYYYADSGEIVVIDIVIIPIHDHSSLIQGGPAFGTYYSDYEEEEEESDG